MVLALLCATPVIAQNHGRGPQKCAPGDPHCAQPSGRDEWGQRDNSMGRGPPSRPPVFVREPDRYGDGRRNDRNDRFDQNDRYDRNDRYDGPRVTYRRGDHMPPYYRSKQYVVDDWQGHGLRRPPRGYQWVQNGGDYLLVAITTGIILELLLNQ